MHISIAEAGNYYRGLLLLVKKDNKVDSEEKLLLMRLGKSFGFAPSFCSVIVDEILENNYVSKTPPVFSSEQIAKTFIKDGFIVAWCDNEFHPDEEQWLRSVAQHNGIDEDWFLCEKEKIKHLQKNTGREFEDRIQKYFMDSSLKCIG